jgi:hypothetical protein
MHLPNTSQKHLMLDTTCSAMLLSYEQQSILYIRQAIAYNLDRKSLQFIQTQNPFKETIRINRTETAQVKYTKLLNMFVILHPSLVFIFMYHTYRSMMIKHNTMWGEGDRKITVHRK